MGAHAATLAQQAGLSREQLQATTGTTSQPTPRGRLVMRHCSTPSTNCTTQHNSHNPLGIPWASTTKTPNSWSSSCWPAGTEPSATWPTGSSWRKSPGRPVPGAVSSFRLHAELARCRARTAWAGHVHDFIQTGMPGELSDWHEL
jgi:hypothetical protein